jgi:hypothetical protein
MYASAYQPIRIEGNRRQVVLCEDVDAARALLLQGRGNDGGVWWSMMGKKKCWKSNRTRGKRKGQCFVYVLSRRKGGEEGMIPKHAITIIIITLLCTTKKSPGKPNLAGRQQQSAKTSNRMTSFDSHRVNKRESFSYRHSLVSILSSKSHLLL